MSRNIGQDVATSDFFATLDATLGQGAHDRMQFTCQDGNLVDIYMNLLDEIPAAPDLKALLAAAQPGFRSNCGERFRVDGLGGNGALSHLWQAFKQSQP